MTSLHEMVAYAQQGDRDDDYDPTPAQCCECDQEAVGYDEGSPFCADCYRRRPAICLAVVAAKGESDGR